MNQIILAVNRKRYGGADAFIFRSNTKKVN